MSDYVELALSIFIALWVYFRFFLSVNDDENLYMIYDPSSYSTG